MRWFYGGKTRGKKSEKLDACPSTTAQVLQVSIFEKCETNWMNRYKMLCMCCKKGYVTYLSSVDQEHTGHGQLYHYQNEQQDKKLETEIQISNRSDFLQYLTIIICNPGVQHGPLVHGWTVSHPSPFSRPGCTTLGKYCTSLASLAKVTTKTSSRSSKPASL